MQVESGEIENKVVKKVKKATAAAESEAKRPPKQRKIECKRGWGKPSVALIATRAMTQGRCGSSGFKLGLRGQNKVEDGERKHAEVFRKPEKKALHSRRDTKRNHSYTHEYGTSLT